MKTHHIFLRTVFTLVAIAALGWYLFAPEDQTKRFDTMALGLLAIAALPWLGALVEEFKIGGVEAKLRAIQEEAEVAADAASAAREVAEELAFSRPVPTTALFPEQFESGTHIPDEDPFAPAGDGGENDQDSDELATIPEPTSAPTRPDPKNRLEMLARHYVKTRNDMNSSAGRTAQMTTIFADMQQEARHIGGDDENILGWMSSADAGRQLAAIAWLRNFPAAAPPSLYIDLIERTTQPFVQYWGLRALSGRMSALGMNEFSIADRINLKEFESLMRAGTDRHTQIRRINRKLAGRTPID